MEYLVPGMTLIPQDKTMSCWYASGMMLVHWRRNQVRKTEMSRPDPGQVKKWGKLYDMNPGIQNDQIPAFAKDLGLEMIPPMSASAPLIESWLRDYGPLWVNGKAHITVIAGIRDTGGQDEVLVYDPAKPHSVHGEWRSYATWYAQDGHSGRDTSAGVATVFLKNSK